VAVGGEHLTNDLAVALRLTAPQAEKLKLRHGRAEVQARDRSAKVWLDGNFAIGDRQFPQLAIEQVTAARTTEILEVVRKRLGAAFTPETCAAGVVLTGGAAKLPGLAAAAARVFGVPAHLGDAPGWISPNLRDPGYHTALGLLYYGIIHHGERRAPARARNGLFAGVRRLFAD
jgi:cell division protein FtsA